LKKIKILTEVKQVTSSIVITAIICTASVFVGGANTAQVFGSVIKQPAVVYKNQIGIAMGEGLSIRKGPGTQYGWQGGFHLGTTIKILGTSGSWYKVSYSGVTGYVSNQYVTIVTAIDQANATKSLVVKSSPGTSYNTLGTIKAGTTVEIYGGVPVGIDQYNWASYQQYGWSEIKYGNKYAWVDTSNLKFANPYNWAPGIKAKFENELVKDGYARKKTSIQYKKPSTYASQGFYQVYTDLYGQNCVVNVNVKTGWFHG